MKRWLLLGLTGIIFCACERAPEETTPRKNYVFSPSAAAPAPTATPRVITVVRPTPTPTPAKGWIQIQADRWERAKVRPEKAHFVAAIAAQIKRSEARYQTVEISTHVPWRAIGSIHSLEASLDFRANLANGDPLTAPTRHIPRGRPPGARFPVSWEAAASDALEFDNMAKKDWSGIPQALQNVEGYNGFGYQRLHPDVPTPYLWAWSTIERPGKFIADGQYSPTARSQQAGAAMIWKALQ